MNTNRRRTWRVIESLVIIMVVFLCCCSSAKASQPVELTVGEGFEKPIGFYDATPVFSWKLQPGQKSTAQSAYRIVAAGSPQLLPENADLWDSGRVESNQSVWVQYDGKPLGSCDSVYWQVKFWDQDGRESGWSEQGFFELGLLGNADWKGEWIRKGPSGRPAEDAAEKKEKPGITIKKAVYGVAGDPAKQVDVTEKVRSAMQSDRPVVKAGNDLGGDPAYGTVKQLMVEYSIDGVEKKETIAENSYFNPAGVALQSASSRFVPEYFRKEFKVDSTIAKARLSVTAMGLYEVYLNGGKVGKDFMAPGFTQYDKRFETLTYDVTGMIERGDNAIGAILGEGWYAGDLMTKRLRYPAAKPFLLIQLEIRYKDGGSETIVSDGGWKATDEGPLRYSSIYHGEIYDAAREMPGWSKTGFDDSAWAGVITKEVEEAPELDPKRHHAVRATEELPAVKVTEPSEGRYVFDLGQNMVGWARIAVPAEKGGKITIRFAEMLKKDGTLYTANYRGARSTDYYIPARTGRIEWHPVFTFHGFRYVELSGVPEDAEPGLDWVTGVVLHSDFDRSGTFVSSHDLLNKLQKNITWGQRGNYLDIPTDCPQRDERLGWTGDAQVFCATSFFNYDVFSFWRSWLQSVRDAQKDNGYVTHVVPDVGTGQGSPGWGDVAVVAPWDVYVRTGNKEVLEDNYEMMKRWVGAYEREAKNYLVGRGGFQDWLQPYANTRGQTPGDYIATAYFGRCAMLMEKTARVLGNVEDARYYGKLHDNIKAAVSENYFNAEGKCTKADTQTACLMALAFDLLKPGLRKGAVENLLRLIDAAGGHLRTGFLGTPLIAFELDNAGRTDLAYQVLFKETYPSWFFSIHQGATTMWERWNSYSHEDGFGNAGMNSFNHYAYGAIGQFMYERIAGLAPDPEQPGYKHFFVQPQPGGPLTMARAALETPYGKAASGWKRKGGRLQVTAIVPPNTTATFIVPAGGDGAPVVTENGRRRQLQKQGGHFVLELGAGTHQFIVR